MRSNALTQAQTSERRREREIDVHTGRGGFVGVDIIRPTSERYVYSVARRKRVLLVSSVGS